MSKRLIITLPDSIAKALAAEAKDREVSMACVLRDAFREHLCHKVLKQADRHPFFMPRRPKGPR